MAEPLGRVLVERGLITGAQLETALAEQRRNGNLLGQTLIDLGMVDPDAMMKALGEHFGIPGTRLIAYTIDPAVLPAIPQKVARKYRAIPLFLVGNVLTVAVANPRDLAVLDDLRFVSGHEIQPVVALEYEIAGAVERFYHEEGGIPLAEVAAGTVQVEERQAFSFRRDEEDDQVAVRLLDQILARAVADRASDIHIEPQEKRLRLRLRIDGVLTQVANLPADLALSLAARAKVLAGMDIAEHRVPQDGRLTVTTAGRRLDLRASTYPTVWGEKVVLRLLDREALRVRLPEVGLSDAVLGEYRALARRPEGMLLITGPTGSGKTSTLYATLSDLVDTGKNIVTLENPVEYELEGINQGQTNDKAGFTFAAGLRAILRQDPDIILVGEIRDRETLDVAVEASLTGHLVLSTLHTNSAVATVTRLMEMGLEPYLLVSTVLGIVAQRLVRRICARCRTTVAATSETAKYLPSPPPQGLARGAGCKECGQTGYRGRAGIFEMLKMTDELRRLILERAPEDQLETVNRRNGFPSLRDEGLARVRAGVTTLEEVLRATQVRE